MAYSVRPQRGNPACLVLLIDQSGSMLDQRGGWPQSKAEAVADAVNSLLSELLALCTRRGEQTFGYCDVALIGYGAGQLRPLLGDGGFVSTTGLASLYRMVEREVVLTDPFGRPHQVTQRQEAWIDPHADGDTPMRRAFEYAVQLVEEWARRYPGAFPPIVINVTDGQANDVETYEELVESARRVGAVRTRDGAALLFNLHLSETDADSVMFPVARPSVDPYAGVLYDMSSPVPPSMRESGGMRLADGARGFIFNGDAQIILRFLRWGTPVL